MKRVIRIKEAVRPHGPVGKTKLYRDAKAGLVELRKVGGMTVIEADEFARYVRGKPLDLHAAAGAA